MATKASSSGTMRRVGAWEWVALPEFAISCTRARLDPGSPTSWLPADGWQRVTLDKGPGVAFRVYPLPDDPRTFVWVEAPLVSTIGRGFRVRTPVTLGEETWEVDFDLRLRHAVTCLTLGASALGERFAVDPRGGGRAGSPRVWPPERNKR